MKAPLVFSFVKEQRTFLMLLMSLLTFLSVLCLGLAIALGTAVTRWNMQWNMMATVQIMPGGDIDGTQKALEAIKQDIASTKNISEADSVRMLRPWLKDSEALKQYIPKMIEIEFKSRTGLSQADSVIKEISGARFIRHTDGMRGAIGAGWKVIVLAVVVLAMVLGAIIACISHITRNITLIHRRELEILHQIGARDNFIAGQLMKVIAKICAAAAAIGFTLASPALLVVTSIAHSMRVGMFTQMAIPSIGWIILGGLSIGIILLSVFTAKKTVIKILNK
ncbi:MAG: hypothetical protein FWG80_03660 [Alphaproteobacteria bacterium]|nr:hypothetical protein [Alphaproteobacteria bacterium]